MAYCRCFGTVKKDPKTVCDDCLRANPVTFGCGQGLHPCGDTTSFELNEYNENKVTAVYSLLHFDPSFTAVTISPTGLVNVTTGIAADRARLNQIMYMVQDGKFKNYGFIFMCFDSMCEPGCTTCNDCTGECMEAIPGAHEKIVLCGAVGTFDSTTILDTTSCGASLEYAVSKTSSQIVTASISDAGIVSYTMASPATPGTYDIKIMATCPDFSMTAEVVLHLIVEDKCIGVVVGEDEKCDPCTGNVTDKVSDLEIIKMGVGFVGSGTGFVNN